jgi:hypothetical protein
LRGSNKRNEVLSPADCIAQLPELPLVSRVDSADSTWHQAELRRSLLVIADLNHVAETELVRAVVRNTLGRVPDLDE